MKKWNWLATTALVAALAVFAGCDSTSPQKPTITVGPENTSLQGQTVAVIVDAPEKILFENARIGSQLGEKIAANLKNNLGKPGLEQTRIVDSRNIDGLKASNTQWRKMSANELAAKLGVDRVLMIRLTDYDWLDKSAHNLVRATIAAEVGIYDRSSSPISQDQKIQVAIPPNDSNPVPQTSQNIKVCTQAAENEFIRTICQKFYRHTEPAK